MKENRKTNQTDKAKFNKTAKNEFLEGKSSEMPKSFKKIFTDEETREILENTIRFRKSDKRIYTLITLWMCNLLQSNAYKQFKIITNNAPIDVLNFDNNCDATKEVVHSVLEEMLSITPYRISEKRRKELGLGVDEEVLKGFVYSTDWTMSNKQIFKYAIGKVGFALHRAISKLFRSQQATANHFTEKNKEKMLVINHIATSSTDMQLVTSDKIRELWGFGITDADMYRYRHIFRLGNLENFVELTPELMDKVSYTTDNEKKNTDRMNMYDEMYKILNSNSVKRHHRDFLKAKFKIPSMVIEDGVIKEFVIEMKDFFKLHKQYYKVLNPIIEVQNKRGRKVERYTFDEDFVTNTDFYKEAIGSLKKVLLSNLNLEIMSDKVSDDINLFDEEDYDWSDSMVYSSKDSFDRIRGQY